MPVVPARPAELPDTVVSVVLACRDGERWVGEQLASILGQTRPVDEVVVVDDASLDRTVEVVHAVAAEHRTPVTVVRRSEALGLSGNLEDGLRRARGDVLLLSDQDDVWEPDKVAVVLAALHEHPGAWGAFSDGVETDAAGVPTGRRLWEPAGLSGPGLAAFRADPLGLLLRGNCVTGATLALRRQALDLVLPLPEHGFHDGWIALLLAAARGCDGLVAVPQPLVRYRVHGDNHSGGLAPGGVLGFPLWYLDRGHLAEERDHAQLAPAVARLRQAGVDPARVEAKLAFASRRRALPRRVVPRARAVARGQRDYVTYGIGRFPALADALWYDADRGRPRPLPGRLRPSARPVSATR